MEKKWFRSKKYGWGWYPSRWQGWTVLLIYIAYLYTRVTIISSYSDTQAVFLARLAFEIIPPTILLIGVCYVTGEKPSWHWGDTKKKRKR